MMMNRHDKSAQAMQLMALFDRSRRRTSSAAIGSEPDVADGSSQQQVLTQLRHWHTIHARV